MPTSHVTGRPRDLDPDPTAGACPPALTMLNITDKVEDHELSLKDIVFSCCVCQDPLSAIYNGKDHSVGLRKDSDGRFGKVVKLYLTSCAHVVCTKHFEGGGQCSKGNMFLHVYIDDKHIQASRFIRSTSRLRRLVPSALKRREIRR